MRQRKVKDLEAKMESVSAFLVKDPSPEIWDRVFGPDRGRYLEIGCGKGDFLLQQALIHPESDYIGVEGQASVVLRAMEKAARIEGGIVDEDDPDWMRVAAQAGTTGSSGAKPVAVKLSNIRFVCTFINGMNDLFAPGSLDGIYLNFSDPWPKGRHVKRRLTWRGRLQDYACALKPGGFIAVKTDNDALFDFTLEEIEACGWSPAELTRDLHGPDGRQYEARQVMTEYERKFHEAGKHINYVKVIV